MKAFAIAWFIVGGLITTALYSFLMEKTWPSSSGTEQLALIYIYSAIGGAVSGMVYTSNLMQNISKVRLFVGSVFVSFIGVLTTVFLILISSFIASGQITGIFQVGNILGVAVFIFFFVSIFTVPASFFSMLAINKFSNV